jgi:hypothetical protein
MPVFLVEAPHRYSRNALPFERDQRRHQAGGANANAGQRHRDEVAPAPYRPLYLSPVINCRSVGNP